MLYRRLESLSAHPEIYRLRWLKMAPVNTSVRAASGVGVSDVSRVVRRGDSRFALQAISNGFRPYDPARWARNCGRSGRSAVQIPESPAVQCQILRSSWRLHRGGRAVFSAHLTHDSRAWWPVTFRGVFRWLLPILAGITSPSSANSVAPFGLSRHRFSAGPLGRPTRRLFRPHQRFALFSPVAHQILSCTVKCECLLLWSLMCFDIVPPVASKQRDGGKERWTQTIY